MSENYDDPKDIWSGVEALLERWLDERRELLVQYTEIATTSESLTELETIKQAYSDCEKYWSIIFQRGTLRFFSN